MDKEIIARNFSRCAYFYDNYADIQKISALEIMGGLDGHNFSRILEIGCGTGNYTLLLREKFKKAKITALDISDKMVEVASDKLKGRGIEFIVDDAEFRDFPAAEFDLITSNACFQWFENLEAALKRYRALLKRGGLISFSVFGPLTFRELNASLQSQLKNYSITADKFINKDKINKILKDNFVKFTIKEFKLQESFEGLGALLNKIKYTGVRGNGSGTKAYFSPRCIKKIEQDYLDKFKQIKVTYQFFSCRGVA